MADEAHPSQFSHLSYTPRGDFDRGEEEEEEEEEEVEESDSDRSRAQPELSREEEAEWAGPESTGHLTQSLHRLHCRETATVTPRSSALTPRPVEVVSKGPPMNAASSASADSLRANATKSFVTRAGPISEETNRRLRQKLDLARQHSLASGASSPGSSVGERAAPTDYQPSFAPQLSPPTGSTTPTREQLRDQWCRHRRTDEQNSQDRCNRDTGLIRLVRAGDMDGLGAYLSDLSRSYRLPIEVNTPNASSLTPLAIAVYQGNEAAIELLVGRGADPGKVLSMGNNCFHVAADCDDRGLCLVKLLEVTHQQFGADGLEQRLNAPNMFNAHPVDVLYLRLRAARDPQQRQPVEQMISVMAEYRARANMNHSYYPPAGAPHH